MLDVNSNEQTELTKKCEACFERESEVAKKYNPPDAKWLETALLQGTSRDRANAGALLVQTNPISNLSALSKLIQQTKVANNSSPDVVEVLGELFSTSLLPKDRKLIALQQRVADYRKLKKDDNVSQDEKNRIYAYWRFEDQLKDHYYTYLQNLQAQLLSNKETNKSTAIRVASNLLMNGPEREAYLLNIIVNKLGDPVTKIASKASYRLQQVLFKHPNMSGVIVAEVERLLFRPNISESTQHFALSFLTSIARYVTGETCKRLLRICFSYFKIKTEKGDVNSKIMKLILLGIRTAVSNADTTDENLIPAKTLDTIYKMIYVSEITTALHALSVLLQVVISSNMNHDRFYNALYRKILDPELVSLGPKFSSLFFHIFHRAVSNDPNNERAQAFIKRLLQAALGFTSAKAAGALIVVHKILKQRAPLLKDGVPVIETAAPVDIKKFMDDSDDEEVYYDAIDEEKTDTTKKKKKKLKVEDEKERKPAASWVHTNMLVPRVKVENGDKEPTKYDPYHRSAAFAGAQFTRKYELIELMRHFHPSVRKFAIQVINHAPMTYFGDPLKDFALTTFLDRFSFKNPKKAAIEEKHQTIYKDRYKPQGSRGISVHSLTKQNCTEDEKFIFEFLESKREKRREVEEKIKKEENSDDDELSDAGTVSDDEFNDYLDTLGAASQDPEMEEDIDYMGELGNEMVDNGKKDKAKKVKKDDEDGSDSDDDDGWDDELNGSDDELDENLEIDADGSLSLDEDELDDDEDDDASVITFSDEEEEDSESEEPQPSTKKRKINSEKEFQKKLKSSDPKTLFADTDEFADLFAEASKTKSHGTGTEIFNKDKSAQKQMSWEAKRMKGADNWKDKKFNKFNNKGNTEKKSFRKDLKKDFKGKNKKGNVKPFKPQKTTFVKNKNKR